DGVAPKIQWMEGPSSVTVWGARGSKVRPRLKSHRRWLRSNIPLECTKGSATGSCFSVPLGYLASMWLTKEIHNVTERFPVHLNGQLILVQCDRVAEESLPPRY